MVSTSALNPGLVKACKVVKLCLHHSARLTLCPMPRVEPCVGVQTNAHVVAEALPRESGGAAPERPIICTLQDGRIFEGTLAGYDRCVSKHVTPRV